MNVGGGTARGRAVTARASPRRRTASETSSGEIDEKHRYPGRPPGGLGGTASPAWHTITTGRWSREAAHRRSACPLASATHVEAGVHRPRRDGAASTTDPLAARASVAPVARERRDPRDRGQCPRFASAQLPCMTSVKRYGPRAALAPLATTPYRAPPLHTPRRERARARALVGRSLACAFGAAAGRRAIDASQFDIYSG